MIGVDVEADGLTPGLDGLARALGNMRPVMDDLRDWFIESTTRRFLRGVSPAGVPWAPKSPVTTARYLAKGDKPDPRPLFGPTQSLSSSISGEAGDDFVEWGSPMNDYASMMHYGGKKADFPHLWGDIPARPFLGLDEADRSYVTDTVSDWLARAAAGG